jgi:hypothetical protein
MTAKQAAIKDIKEDLKDSPLLILKEKEIIEFLNENTQEDEERDN